MYSRCVDPPRFPASHQGSTRNQPDSFSRRLQPVSLDLPRYKKRKKGQSREMELPEGVILFLQYTYLRPPSRYYSFTSRTHPNDKMQGPRGTLHMAFCWLPVYIYIYIRRVRNIQLRTDSANAKLVVGQYYPPDVFSPLVLLARTILRQTDRQTDITYLPTYYPLTKRCSVIAK